MARVHLDLPDEFIFDTELAVRVADLDYGGHVGHDNILTLIQEARVSFYRSLGFVDETHFEDDVGQIIIDVAVQYKSESFLGDILMIQIAVCDISRYTFDMVYRVSDKQSGREVALAKTGIACFDYNRRKVAPIPESLLRNLKSPT